MSDKDPSGIRAFVAGGVGGMVFLVSGQPFDTIKVRMQNQVRGALYKSSIDCLHKTIRYEGVLALYKGMMVPLCACIPYSAVWFLGHKHGIKLQQRVTKRQEMGVMNHGLAGIAAGTYMTFIIAPGERVKCLLQLQTTGKRQYSGPFDVVRRTFAQGGIRQIYKGTLITAIRDVPGSWIFFVLNESTLRYVGNTSPATILCAGGVAGIGMWFVGVMPDVVKTKYQTAPPDKYKSFVEVIPDLYKTEGIRGFFKGFGPSGFRAFIANGICLLTYELTLKTWERLFPFPMIRTPKLEKHF